MIKHQKVAYGENFQGDLFLPEGEEPHPCIILFHAWMGKDAFVIKKAEELVTTLGIATFCADLYGDGKCVKTAEEATKLMQPLVQDPNELRRRALLAFETASSQELVKKDRMGAIGFCFGGHTVIELYKSCPSLKGACAFHPVISKDSAKSLPLVEGINGKLLLLLGYLDPLINKQDLSNLEEELTKRELDWQANLYGVASHAFTNPDARDPENGLIYNANVSTRSFAAMSNFFLSIL